MAECTLLTVIVTGFRRKAIKLVNVARITGLRGRKCARMGEPAKFFERITSLARFNFHINLRGSTDWMDDQMQRGAPVFG